MSLFKNKKKSNISKYLDSYKTNKSLAVKITELLGGYTDYHDDIYEELLILLIEADVGVEASEKMIDQLKILVNERFVRKAKDVIDLLIEIMIENYKDKNILEIDHHQNKFIMMVGVNGSGKTTSISKISKFYLDKDLKVGLIAADTFRAGAVNQLKKWAERLEIHCITGKENADPASVLVDGCRYYLENPVDIIIADTAGRLQNKTNLMKELEKMVKVTKRTLKTDNLDIWLTIDATTGQNGLSQAEVFIESSKVNAVVLTKMDGTSKGGIVLSINDKYNLPVKFMTFGESMNAIEEFNIENYVNTLIKGET
ncbi:MAG TPA: signal recognition particle-docking protein FtsY [Erysipelotrichaceae bacterium]|jgi:fused signal recognition particle receptor|nr:signal recognition particle-docking protein FtsY [Erysipelotrichia bacterium]HPX32737.1 signal recognition particle-docking protein FtsY [Erysipelotrichaceae bacterium]HQA85301.1 signal recognition particle-docking protein FtsY [Erysipelotrichaceae bacterium]